MSVSLMLHSPYPTVISQQDITIIRNCGGHGSRMKPERETHPPETRVQQCAARHRLQSQMAVVRRCLQALHSTLELSC